MKEIIKITVSLTCVCIAAALILGTVYTQTDHYRKEQEEKTIKESIEGLLGYGKGTKVPADLHIYPIHRYVISNSEGQTVLGYVLPLKDKGYALAVIDLAGKPEKVIPLTAKEADMAERGSRDGIVNDALPKGSKATWTQTIYVPVQGDKRLGYVVEGITQGFKRPIKLMVSLDPQFTVTGLAILEHEEDPGLGAEIVQDYFKNQFAGKTLDVLKNLKVVKEPLPEDYLPALEPARAQKAAIRADKIKEIKDKYLKSDIYAITGATISSRAVTNGVTNSVRKFVYRLGILSEAIKQENLQVAF